MLAKGEPYRYSVPRTTEAKFARLRVRATGQKKKTGVAVGTPRSQNYGTGQSVVFAKSLNQVYAENGLPKIERLPAGERAMLQAHGLRSSAVENLNTAKPLLCTAKSHAEKKEVQSGGSRLTR